MQGVRRKVPFAALPNPARASIRPRRCSAENPKARQRPRFAPKLSIDGARAVRIKLSLQSRASGIARSGAAKECPAEPAAGEGKRVRGTFEENLQALIPVSRGIDAFHQGPGNGGSWR